MGRKIWDTKYGTQNMGSKCASGLCLIHFRLVVVPFKGSIDHICGGGLV